MFRFSMVLCACLFVSSLNGQTISQSTASDPTAISLAQQSVKALIGSATVNDATLSSNVTSILGSDYETGTAVFQAKGTSESRVVLSLGKSTRSDIRNSTGSSPGGTWKLNGGTAKTYAPHNCLTDAPWFFPAASSLTQANNARYVFKYIGQEQQGGIITEHIKAFQSSPDFPTLQQLSTMDFYLDPQSFLPMAISFTIHPDDNMGLDIPVRINFANYQLVQGVEIPFHIQEMLNGSVTLDATVTSAALNTGLSDSLFILQ